MLFKPSIYNYIKTGEKFVAICNTFSGGLAILEHNEYNKLQNVHFFNKIDNDLEEWLKQGFIVDNNKDELSIVNYCRCRDAFLNNRPIYRILTTTACNARCFYCYEKGRTVQFMSKETAIKTADFIIKHAENAKEILLNWFGGEPLLNYTVITLITQKLSAALNNKITSSIITNASLFSKEMITIAKENWNLNSVQITLDGMAEVHDNRKSYINKCFSFGETIETIGWLLSSNFRIILRLNYDKNNITDIIKLIYFIHETFGNNHNLICYAYPLFNTATNQESSYVYYEDIPRYMPIIINVLMECGYYNPLKIIQRRTNACFATDPYSCVINTDGLLYKCTMDSMEPSRSVGNVNDGFVMNNPLIEWTTPVIPKHCYECKMLPICQGGCRASRMLNMDASGCAIKRQLIEYTLNHLLNTVYHESN